MTAALSPFLNQDLHVFVRAYREAHPEDVQVVDEQIDPDQDLTALTTELQARGLAPMIVAPAIRGVGASFVTNVFASRERVARILGTDMAGIHARFQEAVAARVPPAVVDDVLEERAGANGEVDLDRLPMIRHFAEDAAPYWTSAVVIANDPTGGRANASYHRCMRASPTALATSLHSRGHLWRYLRVAADKGEVLPVAVVVGGHPLFLLACAARVGIDVDERDVAGGLFGGPLEVALTPRYGIGVPATADLVLEGFIDPTVRADEGPFGEYSGYASSRSTNNLIEVERVMLRPNPVVLDVVSGRSPDHLNLGRIPRESDMVAKIRERFPDVVALEYPASGTHFHCYVSVRPGVPGQARQVLLALLALDPYLKLAVAVDDDVDVRREDHVLWAIATRFQADEDVIVLSRLPGSLLDPSSSGGMTARMGLDATRGPGFEGARLTLSDAAVRRASEILGRREPGPAAPEGNAR